MTLFKKKISLIKLYGTKGPLEFHLSNAASTIIINQVLVETQKYLNQKSLTAPLYLHEIVQCSGGMEPFQAEFLRTICHHNE